jgi:hypothetical protein
MDATFREGTANVIDLKLQDMQALGPGVALYFWLLVRPL